jgi:hypothetical protein
MSDAAGSQKSATDKYADYVKEISSLTKRLASLAAKKAVPPEGKQDAELAIEDAKAILNDVENVRGSTGSVFVRLFLGQVNVKAATPADR